MSKRGDYHSLPSLGSSDIKNILKNAKLFRDIKDKKIKIEGEALDLGTYTHSRVLEPKTVSSKFTLVGKRDTLKTRQEIIEILESEKEVKVYPKEILTPGGSLSTSKKAKATLSNIKSLDPESLYMLPKDFKVFNGLKTRLEKIWINDKMDNLAKKMERDLRALPNMNYYLKKGKAEQAYFGEIDGVEVKILVDLIVQDDEVIVIDLKTFGDELYIKNINKNAAKYGWHIQEALYREVLAQNEIEVDRWLFAIASKKEYWGACYYEFDFEAVNLGYERVLRGIQKYSYCLKNNLWLDKQFDFDNNRFFEIMQGKLPAWTFYD